MKVTRKETGWPCHFICGSRCVFHRGTLLETRHEAVIVSTVGAMQKELGSHDYETIGMERHYETMAFSAGRHECGCIAADVTREVSFASPWAMVHADAAHDADAMHEAVVAEIEARMKGGERVLPPPRDDA